MKEEEDVYIIGRKPILEVLNSSVVQIEKIWLQTGIRGAFEKELRQALKGRDIPVQFVPLNKLNKLAYKKNHQGVIALRSHIEYQDVMDVVSHLFDQGKMPLVVLLDGVTDVRNLGAIARSAEIFGVDVLVTPVKNSAIINKISMKISAGALAHLTVCRSKSIVRTIEDLKAMGLQIFSADHQAKNSIDNTDFTGPTAIVFGDEGKGVSHAVEKLIDVPFSIPQYGKTESLNVSVAAGITLYHARKK